MQFRQQQIRFAPTAIPTVSALVALALTLYLASWQQGRATEKRALQAEFDQRTAVMPLQLSANARDANDLRYRSAVARGEWQVDGQIFIDNKIDAGGRAGYHVITPLKLADSTANILVNRGWIARANTYPAPPTVITPPGEVTVSGMIAQPNARFLELSADISAGKVWQNLTIARYVQATKLDVLPFVLIANAPVELGLVQVSERPDAGVAKHVEYMLTWYSLAATVIILWVALNLRITRSNAPSSAPA